MPITQLQGKYGGSARAIADLFQTMGQYEKTRRDLQLQEKFLKLASETDDSGRPKRNYKQIIDELVSTQAKPTYSSGFAGAMQKVGGLFAPPSRNPLIDILTQETIRSVGPLGRYARESEEADIEYKKAQTNLANARAKAEEEGRKGAVPGWWDIATDKEKHNYVSWVTSGRGKIPTDTIFKLLSGELKIVLTPEEEKKLRSMLSEDIGVGGVKGIGDAGTSTLEAGGVPERVGFGEWAGSAAERFTQFPPQSPLQVPTKKVSAVPAKVPAQKSPYPEYPDAFFEEGEWRVIGKDGKKYRIKE